MSTHRQEKVTNLRRHVTGINGPGLPLKQLWKEWDDLHLSYRCKLFRYGGPSTISEAARERSDKVQNQAPLLRKIIWKRDQQRKTEVEIEDISCSSSTRQFRSSIFGEPIEEGTEFNEDVSTTNSCYLVG